MAYIGYPWLWWAAMGNPPYSMDDEQWKITQIWLPPWVILLMNHGPMENFTINIRTRKKVDISMEIPTEERKFRETCLGRQDTNINHSIQCCSTISYLYYMS